MPRCWMITLSTCKYKPPYFIGLLPRWPQLPPAMVALPLNQWGKYADDVGSLYSKL